MAFRRLTRDPLRSAIFLFSVTTASAVSFAIISISWGFQMLWSQANLAHGTHALVSDKNWNGPVPSPVDEDIVALIRTHPHIAEAAGTLSGVVKNPDGMPIVLVGWEPASFVWRHIEIIDGEGPDQSGQGVLLGRLAARTLNLQPGDSLILDGEPTRVTGVFRSDSLFEEGTIAAPLGVAQHLLSLPGQITLADIRFDPAIPRERAILDFQDWLAECQPSLKVLDATTAMNNNFGILAAKSLSLATTAIATLAAILLVLNASLSDALFRRPEFATLTALGWKLSTLLRLVAVESLIISLVGMISGACLGWGMAWGLSAVPWLQGKILPAIPVETGAIALLLLTSFFLSGLVAPLTVIRRTTPWQALQSM